MPQRLSRRRFLSQTAGLGCTLAASPVLTPVTFAAAPWETRLVVIILRGGMDALDVIQPYGDPDYAALRRTLKGGPESGAADLDGFYALHPALMPLRPLWDRAELGFVHAVSTPYRDKRSHFDGQDLLEAGTAGLDGRTDGWLNRLLQTVPGAGPRTAFALGRDDMKLLRGPAGVSNWSPEANLVMSPQAERLAGLVMQEDPLFHTALNEALDLSRAEMGGTRLADQMDEGIDEKMAPMTMPKPQKGRMHRQIAAFAARQLRGDTRVASFSINGWDTHSRQKAGLRAALGRLAETILEVQTGVGPDVWSKTAIVALTEFGRTVRENGTGGTDHGTGGAMVLAGGAIRGGRVQGHWPGLKEADLYARRDLMPTADVRAQVAWILRDVAGLDQTTLENTIFPGVDMGANPKLLR
ncbi:DUF1501 domain-containing protein [Rhodobacteraceae bacterium M382]|nr:DUF1501 domain-containing protein [Rhodobacteraceae bacterium M382]